MSIPKFVLLTSFLVIIILSLVPINALGSPLPYIKNVIVKGSLADPYEFIEYKGSPLEFFFNFSFISHNITSLTNVASLSNITYSLYATYNGRIFYLANNITSISDSFYNCCVIAVWSNITSVEYSLFNGTSWSAPKTLVKVNSLSVITNGSEILVLCRESGHYHVLVFENFSLIKNVSLPISAQDIVAFNSKVIILSNVSFSLTLSSEQVIGYVYGVYFNGTEKFELRGIGLPVYCNRSKFVLLNVANNETNVSIYDDCEEQLYNLHFNKTLSGIFVQNDTLSISYFSLISKETICMYYLSNGKAIKFREVNLPSNISYTEATIFYFIGYVDCNLVLENITSEMNITSSGINLLMYFTPHFIKVSKPALPCIPEVKLQENEYQGVTVLFINYTEPDYYSRDVSLIEILVNGTVVCKLSYPTASIPYYIYANGTYNVTVIAINSLGMEKKCILTTIEVKPNITLKPEIFTSVNEYPGYTLLNISYNAKSLNPICVQLYVNGSLLGKFTTPIGYYVYNVTSNGTYIVTIKAISKSGTYINSEIEKIYVKPVIITSTVPPVTTTHVSTTTPISTTSSGIPTSDILYIGIAVIVIVGIAIFLLLKKK